MLEYAHVWSAMWNTMGLAMEMRREVQSGELMFPALATKSRGVPAIIAPGQNERILLWPLARALPDADHVIMPSAEVKEGVSQGSGL